MSLNMYLGEVRAQSQSMNALCVATIQGMEQAINSIDAFVFDSVLQGQTYDSAKTFFAQTFRTLAQGIIYLCEELIRQNDAFPNDFQSQVASTDVIEQEIRDQIRELEQEIAALEAISAYMPGTQAMLQIYYAMKRKLQEKLEHLYAFNYTSSSNYDTALQLATSVAQGLAQVQGGKGFNVASGTFSIQELNMGWTASIQKITEDKAREVEKLAYSDLAGEETINDETSSESKKKDFDGKKLARDIAGEISGEYDVRRAWDGVDPSTGEKLSTWDRFLAGGMAVAGLTPVGKIAKVGKGVKMTAEAAEVVNIAKKAEQLRNATKYSTRIENKIIDIEKQNIPGSLASTFKDSNYRTVKTTEDVTFYRAFGGHADAGGTFVTTAPASNKIQAKIDLALLPEWKNTRQYEAVIKAPKGTILQIGRAEKQETMAGTILKGDEDQVLLPLGYPLEWIQEVRKIPSK
ncbi:pre-toxin TG domain-containing protein [Bacillus sp. S13(2024)]|uniref:pre-toxin TG domain-containing protein n=1 Tax=unclassified Bacillus (in: firmicutes) TaxID=185979 RepID=UPI003D1A6CD3